MLSQLSKPIGKHRAITKDEAAAVAVVAVVAAAATTHLWDSLRASCTGRVTLGSR